MVALLLVSGVITKVTAFQAQSTGESFGTVSTNTPSNGGALFVAPSSISRESFVKGLSVSVVSSVLLKDPAYARGRATLEKAYERYVPRIEAGGAFYGTDFRKLVERSDWAGIKNALQEPPERKKEDLTKPDSGVAERARQAGQFSDARVVVAMDLFAGSFSDNTISAKTKKMKDAVEKLRASVEGMQSTARQALGEEKPGGLFGFGAKKPTEAELTKSLRQYYVQGGNAYNEFIYAANEELALKFDRLPFVKG